MTPFAERSTNHTEETATMANPDPSRTIVVVCAALEAVANRDPGSVSADVLLDAVQRNIPDVSHADLLMAADFLKRLASRLKGAAWRLDPGNGNNFATPANAGARAQAHAREAHGGGS
jgi:hypothetical protein